MFRHGTSSSIVEPSIRKSRINTAAIASTAGQCASISFNARYV